MCNVLCQQISERGATLVNLRPPPRLVLRNDAPFREAFSSSPFPSDIPPSHHPRERLDDKESLRRPDLSHRLGLRHESQLVAQSPLRLDYTTWLPQTEWTANISTHAVEMQLPGCRAAARHQAASLACAEEERLPRIEGLYHRACARQREIRAGVPR